MTRDINDLQKKFLDLIFQPEYAGKFAQAALDAGYSETTKYQDIVKHLRDEILERADTILALNSPESIQSVLKVLRNPEMKGAKAALEAASMILDRAGITKKERLEIEHKSASGVFILPSKKDT